MKKFDFFLVFLAVALLGVAYYFSQEFKSESEMTSESEKKESSKEPRKPSSKNSQKKDLKHGALQSQTYTPFVQKYVDLKSCLHSQKCDYSQNDPRSYELEALQAINSHLSQIVKMDHPSYLRVLYDAAQLPSGHIKDTVLKALSKNGVYNKKWRDLVLNEYIHFHDAHLIPEVMQYFKEHSSTSDRKVIHKQLYKALDQGSPMVANAIANHLDLILDKPGAKYYRNGLSQMMDGPIKDNVRREVKDFEMKESAG